MAIERDVVKVGKSALKSTRLYKSLKTLQSRRAALKAEQKRHGKFTAWRNDVVRRSGSIALPLTVTGREDPCQYLVVGDECELEQDIQIWVSPETDVEPLLTVKPRVFIGRNSYIGVHEPISIGRNTIIGAYCYIISANHRYENREVPIRDQGFTGAPVIIEDDVWLGTHVVVLPGVTIGKGAVIAASAVVNKSVPDYQVWGGVPAKFIKNRP